MSKLLRLREWVSTATAAKYLSDTLSEPLSESDILRFGLGGKLQLSIYLPNGLGVLKWQVLGESEVIAEFGCLPEPWKYISDAQCRRVIFYCGQYLRESDGNGLNYAFYSDQFVLDVPMLGTERDEIEHEIQRLDAGHALVNRGSGFAFVLSPTGELQSARDMLIESSFAGESDELKVRVQMVQRLGEVGTFVVRPSALTKFLHALLTPAEETTQSGDRLLPRAETTYLTIIGALLELVRTPRPGRDSDAAVIRELIENYSDKPGISKTTLEAKFAEARRRLHST